MRLAAACALWLAALAAPAAAQPYARFAVADSALGPALKASGAQFENAWNALLVAGLRAELAGADSSRPLLALARRVAAAEPGALGSRIASDALQLRAGWRAAQRRLRVSAATAESLGAAARTARAWPRADSAYGAALSAYRRLGERRRVAVTLGVMAGVAFDRNDMAAADSLNRMALAARRPLGDPRLLGNTLNTLGSVAYRQGRLDDAWRYYQEARAIREQSGERATLGTTLGFLANVAKEQGHADTALVYFRQALDLIAAQSDSFRTYEVLQNYAALLSNGAHPGSALPYFERAMTIALQRGSASEQSKALGGSGYVLLQQGHYTEAVAKLEASREAALAAGDLDQLLRTLVTLGQAKLNLGDIAGARAPIERALAIAESLGASPAEALNNLSIVVQEEGDPGGAERLALRALSAAAQAGDSVMVCDVTSSLGQLAVERGDLATAAAWYERAAAAANRENQRLEGIYNLGVVAALVGRLDDADRRFREALALARQAGAPDFESLTLLGLGDVAERRGDVPGALAYDRGAAAMIEGMRASQGSERPSVALLSKRLFAFEALIHLLTRQQASHPDSAFAAEAFAWSERARARAFLDLMSVTGGDARRARPLLLAEAQGLLGSSREALLAYSVGDSSTSLWVVKRDTWKHIALPPRRALRTRIEILRRGLAEPASAEAPATRAAARALYRTLVEPALPMLEGVEHLIVAPDGPLALVPFETLLAADAERDGPAPKGAYLVERYAISYTLSASALATGVAASGEGRRSKARRDGAIVALGNPTFTAAGGVPGRPVLAPLPHSGGEIQALEALAGSRPVTTLTGANATRARLLGLGELPRAALIHIATHGEANAAEPERSGLWMAATGDSAAPGPGFVSVTDILGLDLHAGLVTLSACETGLGRLERGEGMIGLTRAFLAAGARNVMVSLWKVNDRSTALLMERFYRPLLGDDASAANALARAKRALIRRPETRSPFHWAPFVLVGSAGRLDG